MNNKFAKVVAALLCLCMLVGMLPVVALADLVDVEYTEDADDYYKVISKDDYQLAPGIVESEIVLNNAAGTHRQVAHVVEVDLNNEYTKVIPSYKGMIPTPGSYGVQIMSQQAAFAEANGYGNVVAAMNLSLSWYDSAYYKAHPELVGEPLGYMVLDGELYVNSQGQTSGAQTCVVINFDEKDGEARPTDMPKVEIRSTSSAITGWEEQVIPANFGFLVKDGKNQYKVDNNAANGASRSFVGIKADGTFVMVMNDGRQAPFSTGFTNYEMAEFMLSLGCVQAVNGDGGGSSAFLSQRPGEELKINCSPSDGAERETTHGILVISTAPATGEFVRATISAANDYYTPGSTVQFTAVGSDLVGTAAEIPAEVEWQLADPSFGTIENGLFVSNGTEGAVTVQMVYNEAVVGETTIYIVMPDTLTFAQANMVIPYGKTVDLGLSATYDYKNVVLTASDVTFTLSDATIGSISGFDFTAGEEGVAATASLLTATVGGVSTTTNLSLGKGSEIVYDFENQDLTGWKIYTNYGKYGPTGPNGKVTDDNGNYWYHGQNERGYISIVDATTGRVKNGKYALAVECDFTQIFETGYHALNLIFPTIDCTDTVAIGFWMYIPYDARHAEMTIGATNIGNGQLFEFNEGWHYITAQAKDNQFYYINISVDDRAAASDYNNYNYITEPNVNGKYTFYIDDITLDYSSAVDDREAPVFSTPMVANPATESIVAMQGQTINFNNPSFEVSVVENTTLTNAVGIDGTTAKAYIDGKLVDCTYTNGKITLGGLTLSDGYHTVKFSIADKMGNESWVAGSIVVAAGNDAAIKVVPKDPTADRLLVGSLYWMDVVATNIETIDKVELVFDMNNASSWELDGMTVAEGFTATYAVQADDNIATIIIERSGDVKATGSAVLVSFPVRTWTAQHTTYEGYEFATPAWLVNYGTIWHQSIELALEKGVVTFVDETEDTFGMETVLVDTELFFTNYSRKSVAGAQEWINAKKAAKEGWHEHTVTAMADVAATCTTAGYTGRTFCAVCNSVVDWGTIVEATGHDYQDVDGVLKCACGELFNGELNGAIYVDGVIADGWVNDTYYYVNGVMQTGSHFIDGAMYTFDENGVYLPDYKYNGFYEINDTVMYFVNNEYQTGYQWIETIFYNFDKNGFAYDGEVVINGTTCLFDNGVSVETDSVRLAGICGEDAYYVLHRDGRMVISGTGAMMDFPSWPASPWWRQEYRFNIKTIEIGKDITKIGHRAFVDSYATEIKFADDSKLTEISTHAFSQMDGLTTVTIPDGVTLLGVQAFYKCPNLVDVYVPASVKKFISNTFTGSPNVVLHVPENSSVIAYAEMFNIKYVTYATAVANGVCGDNATWELWSDGTLKILGSGAMTEFPAGTAPWHHYLYRNNVTNVVIGKDITTIGQYSFFELKNMTSVVFEEGSKLETIGVGAFGYTGITEISIPATVTKIGDRAFYFCGSLKTVNMSVDSKLTTVGAYAFRDTTVLERVYLPDAVQSIGVAIFYNVGPVVVDVADGSVAHKYAQKNNIECIVREPLPTLKASGECGENAIWEFWSDGTLKILGSGAMADFAAGTAPWHHYLYRNFVTNVFIGKDITTVGQYSFFELKNMTSVVFEEGTKLEAIGVGAFGYTGITEITIPATVTKIGDRAFYFCKALENVYMAADAKLQSIGAYAFRDTTSIKNVYIPDGVQSIGTAIFYNAGSVVVNVASNTVAHQYAVKNGISFTERTPLPTLKASGECGENATWEFWSDGTLKIVGTGAMTEFPAGTAPWHHYLYRNYVTKIVIGKDITSIGQYSFFELKNATTVVFEEGTKLETIGVGAFGYTGITEITIPATVKTIEARAFYFCKALETVTIAENSALKTIGSYAFRDTTALKAMNIPSSVTSMGTLVFYNSPSVVVSVSKASVAHQYAQKNGVLFEIAD